MRNPIRVLAIALLPATLVGCSTDNAKMSDVKTQAVYQIYAVNHDAEKDTAHAYARFRLGGKTGTNLQLTDRSSVRCNDQPLGEANFFGKCYRSNLPGYQNRYTFVFTDPQGKAFRNSIQLEKVDFDPATPERLTRSRSHTIAFAGPALAEGETIDLMISLKPALAAMKKALEDDPFADPKGRLEQPGMALLAKRVKDIGERSVELTPGDLQGLARGEATAQWIRSRSHDLDEATPAGGTIGAAFRSRERAITLDD